MVEASIPTFEAFCENHDAASLSADQDYLQQYGEVIKIYASFASTRPQPVKVQPTAPVAMRWRKAGLLAVLSISSSEALASVAGRQLDVIMPVLLENLWTENEDYLIVLQERAQMEGAGDNERLLKRRMSSATVRTVDTADTNAAALSGSTADADKLAEEDLGVLAMFCLKQLYEANNRQQIRNATLQTIDFVAGRTAKGEKVVVRNPATGEDRGWAPTLFGILSRWAPMQDRYVILVTAMETLVQSPLQEQNMKQQFVLATMISALLKSDINLIGLSVMDVLLGLIQHVLRILQLGGIPHSQQKDVTGESAKEPSKPLIGNPITELVAAPSASRRQLLVQLQNCIGDLATHIYYADQVSVMIKAILVRLKPSPLSAIPTPAAAVEDPEMTANVILASGNLNDDPNTDGFFSFDMAKVTALNSIKQILLVANHRSKNVSGGANLGRNQVSIHVWEGTQWLLRDNDPRVRKAYADALLTWLDLETVKADLKAFDDEAIPKTSRGREDSTLNQKQRAVSATLSTISHRDKFNKSGPCSFLQLLHLAIYENALQFVISEPDMIMLHVLLTNLVNKLGVNAVHTGLPMIFRLQEDIQEVEEPAAKVRIGSVCHGYFWALTEAFDFENTPIGREIHKEIHRRSSKGLWTEGVQIPAPTLAQVGPFSTAKQTFPLQDIATESLIPFDDRVTMIEYIAEAYAESLASPPTSAPNSPGRAFTMPILSSDAAPRPQTTDHDLPTKIRTEMLYEWSRESAIAAAQEIGNKSRTSPSARSEIQGLRLAVNNNGIGNGTSSGTNGGTSSPHARTGRSPSSKAYGLVGGLGALQKLRNSSLQDTSPSRGGGSISSHTSTTRIDQLKKALTTHAPVGGLPVSRGGRRTAHSDASSESMVSYTFTNSEMSYNPTEHVPLGTSTRSRSRDRVGSGGSALAGDISNGVESDRRTVSRDDAITLDQYLGEIESDPIPPVPPLPATFSQRGSGDFEGKGTPPLRSDGPFSLNGSGGWTGRGSGGSGFMSGGAASVRASKSREREPSIGVLTTDLESLLKGIGTSGGEKRGLVGRAEPPY